MVDHTYVVNRKRRDLPLFEARARWHRLCLWLLENCDHSDHCEGLPQSYLIDQFKEETDFDTDALEISLALTECGFPAYRSLERRECGHEFVFIGIDHHTGIGDHDGA